MIIPIDGPAGAGKSTIALQVSRKLHIEYIDSGALYRALTLFAMNTFSPEIHGYENQVANYFSENPKSLQIKWIDGQQKVYLKAVDISSEIRTPKVTRNIKYIANHGCCRDIVNQTMRKIADTHSFVIDGRDIGTEAFPSAKYKFYLDASAEVRAKRRAKETNIPIESEAFKKLKLEIIERDKNDINRKIAPLKKAENATYIDTSNLNIEEVISCIMALVHK